MVFSAYFRTRNQFSEAGETGGRQGGL